MEDKSTISTSYSEHEINLEITNRELEKEIELVSNVMGDTIVRVMEMEMLDMSKEADSVVELITRAALC